MENYRDILETLDTLEADGGCKIVRIDKKNNFAIVKIGHFTMRLLFSQNESKIYFEVAQVEPWRILGPNAQAVVNVLGELNKFSCAVGMVEG